MVNRKKRKRLKGGGLSQGEIAAAVLAGVAAAAGAGYVGYKGYKKRQARIKWWEDDQKKQAKWWEDDQKKQAKIWAKKNKKPRPLPPTPQPPRRKR